MLSLKSLVRSMSPFSSRNSSPSTKTKQTTKSNTKVIINNKDNDEEELPPPDEDNIYETFSWDLRNVNFVEALSAFYKQYNPTKVNKVSDIVKEFQGEEILLLQELCQKYVLTEDQMKVYLDRCRGNSKQTNPIAKKEVTYAKQDSDFSPNEDFNDFRMDTRDSSLHSKSSPQVGATTSNKVLTNGQALSNPSPPVIKKRTSVFASVLDSIKKHPSNDIEQHQPSYSATVVSKPPPPPPKSSQVTSPVPPPPRDIILNQAIVPPPPPKISQNVVNIASKNNSQSTSIVPPLPPTMKQNAFPPPPPVMSHAITKPTIDRNSIDIGTLVDLKRKEIIRPADPTPPPLVIQSKKPPIVVSDESSRRSSVIVPSESSDSTKERIDTLPHRYPSPNLTEVMAVGGQKVSNNTKNVRRNDLSTVNKEANDCFTKGDTLSVNSDDASVTSNMTTSRTAIFYSQPKNNRASVVTANKDTLKVGDDDQDDLRSDISKESRNNLTSTILINHPRNHNEEESSNVMIGQLKSELELTRKESKEMFETLTKLMKQDSSRQSSAQAEPATSQSNPMSSEVQTNSIENVDVEKLLSKDTDATAEMKGDSSPSHPVKLKLKIPSAEESDRVLIDALLHRDAFLKINQLENEIKSLKHDNRKLTLEVEDLQNDKKDLFNLLQSITIAQVKGRAVLESYVSQYGYGVDESKGDILARIDAVLRHRRKIDANPEISPIAMPSTKRTDADASTTPELSPKSSYGQTISILGSPKAVPGMAKSHTVTLKDILQSNDTLESYRQYTQSTLGKLVTPSIPYDGYTQSKSRTVPSSPLPGTVGGINSLKITSGGLISSDSQSVSQSSDTSPSRYMNINSNSRWDQRNPPRESSSNTMKISSNSSLSSSTGHGLPSPKSFTPLTLLKNYEANNEPILSTKSFSKVPKSSDNSSKYYRDPYNPVGARSKSASSDHSRNALANEYERSKDYYRKNATQAKVAQHLAQNRLNYKTGMTGEAMIETLLAVDKRLNENHYSDDEDNMSRSVSDRDDGVYDWVERWDDIRSRKYYYSKSRKKSVWKLPYDDNNSKKISQNYNPSRSPSSTPRKSDKSVSIRTTSPRKMTEFHNTSYDKSPWVPVFDPKAKRQYWYHSVTRQTTWTDPHEN